MAGAHQDLPGLRAMSNLADISRHFDRLTEISGILTAMKSLSLVETRKLARFIAHQRQMLANIEAAAVDYFHFYPVDEGDSPKQIILLLMGSERGFCGNFNERMLAALLELPVWQQAPKIVLIGQRLNNKLASHPDVMRCVVAHVEGVSVTEDVPAILGQLMDTLHGICSLSALDTTLYSLAHDAEGEPQLKCLLPIAPAPTSVFSYPPALQLPSATFLSELLDQYLLAALHGLVYESLTAESYQRLAHMEHALDHLDATLAELSLKRNALRQEKIIEEIEVILSSELAFH